LALTWQSDLDVVELVTLSQSLQEQNSELLGHVEQLETLLDECHSALQLQMKRNHSLETRLNEQNQELSKTQEQLTRLFRELEASHQVAQRQQILIETLSEQMESSQEQVAQLERECAHIQQRYNEQSFNLSISENTCTELRSRLERQQRYSLQLKAALDKCLEVPSQTELAADIASVPVGAELQYNPQNASARLRLLLKPQPIQPWSVCLDAVPEDIPSEQPDQTDSSSEPGLNLPLTEETPEAVSHPIESLLQEEPEVASKAIKDTTPVPVAPKAKLSDDLPDLSADVSQNIKEAEEVLWEELERLTEAAIASTNIPAAEPPVAPQPIHLQAWKPITPEPISNRQEVPQPQDESAALPEPTSVSSSSIVPVTPNESIDLSEAANWPAPVVYPQRPQKKIKSLAAIDLPSFPRLGK
jgi:myosin heavy subunit